MDGMRFTYSVHLHGTLAANGRGEFALPCGATLVGASVGGSNANGALLDVGTADDRDGILDAVAIGASGTPAAFTPLEFNGALADGRSGVHFAAGAVVTWDLDFDGAGGTAAANVSLVLTFLEG